MCKSNKWLYNVSLVVACLVKLSRLYAIKVYNWIKNDECLTEAQSNLIKLKKLDFFLILSHQMFIYTYKTVKKTKEFNE